MLAVLGSQLRCVSAAAVLPLWQRGIAAATDSGTAQQTAQTAAVGAGLIEMRDYTIKPVRMQTVSMFMPRLQSHMGYSNTLLPLAGAIFQLHRLRRCGSRRQNEAYAVPGVRTTSLFLLRDLFRQT